MRQSIEMWEAGLDYVAQQLELDWLAEGMDFHVTVDGIGVDPIDFTHDIAAISGRQISGQGPCHGVKNPFDIQAWENLPGFDSHHEARSGTYVEDCGGAGGNICFAVNTAVDPGGQEFFDLVSHEVGHCLTIGHVVTARRAAGAVRRPTSSWPTATIRLASPSACQASMSRASQPS